MLFQHSVCPHLHTPHHLGINTVLLFIFHSFTLVFSQLEKSIKDVDSLFSEFESTVSFPIIEFSTPNWLSLDVVAAINSGTDSSDYSADQIQSLVHSVQRWKSTILHYLSQVKPLDIRIPQHFSHSSHSSVLQDSGTSSGLPRIETLATSSFTSSINSTVFPHLGILHNISISWSSANSSFRRISRETSYWLGLNEWALNVHSRLKSPAKQCCFALLTKYGSPAAKSLSQHFFSRAHTNFDEFVHLTNVMSKFLKDIPISFSDSQSLEALARSISPTLEYIESSIALQFPLDRISDFLAALWLDIGDITLQLCSSTFDFNSMELEDLYLVESSITALADSIQHHIFRLNRMFRNIEDSRKNLRS